MLRRLLLTIVLGGLPRFVRQRRPIPVVWFDWIARHRSADHLARVAGDLARGGTRPTSVVAVYAGDGVPETHTVDGIADAVTAVFVRVK
jgi:hypothetical protein